MHSNSVMDEDEYEEAFGPSTSSLSPPSTSHPCPALSRDDDKDEDLRRLLRGKGIELNRTQLRRLTATEQGNDDHNPIQEEDIPGITCGRG